MSKTFVYDRFDMIAGDGPGVYQEPASDGEWVKAKDAINRDAVLNAQIRTLEVQLKDTRAELDALEQVSRYADSVCDMLRQGGWPGKAEALEQRIRAAIAAKATT